MNPVSVAQSPAGDHCGLPGAPASGTSTQPGPDALTDLKTLAVELAARGLQADLHAPRERLPCLYVRNPQASMLSEQVHAASGAYWYSWGERIAGCDQPATAAGILARVLRTVDSAP
jgi:hypothetical protein